MKENKNLFHNTKKKEQNVNYIFLEANSEIKRNRKIKRVHLNHRNTEL